MMNDEYPAAIPQKPRRQVGWAVIAGILFSAAACGFWAWRVKQNSLPARLREQSDQAVRRGRWNDAGILAAQLVELDPRDGEAWLLRARAASEQGDVAESARILADVPVEGEQKLTALRALAELQLGPQNKPLAAVETLLQILERDPRSKFAYQRLIYFYAMTFQRGQLVRRAREAMERECEPVEAFSYVFFADSLHFTNGVEISRRWLAGSPGEELFVVAEAASFAIVLKGGVPREEPEVVRQFRELADMTEARLTALFQQYPDNLEVLAWHIERAMELGNVDRVVELLSKLPPGADDDNRFQRYAGWAHMQLGSPDLALARFQQALAIHPLDWQTRHLLAGLRRQLQQLPEAADLDALVQTAGDLRRALEVLPDGRSVPDELLSTLADYAARCGDELFAKSLRRHLGRLAESDGREK